MTRIKSEPETQDPMTSELRDGMRIDWDVPIAMDDGVVLRADVYRPIADGKYPVIMQPRPLRQGPGVPGRRSRARGNAWSRSIPDVPARLDQQVPELGSGRSRRSGCRTAMCACASTPAVPAARPATSNIWSPRESEGLPRLHRVGGARSRGRTARSASTAFPTTR